MSGSRVAAEQLQRLHAAQAAFYGGGPSEPLTDLLTPDVVWRVPGESPIAGVYEGVDSVLEYFARRRDIARDVHDPPSRRPRVPASTSRPSPMARSSWRGSPVSGRPSGSTAFVASRWLHAGCCRWTRGSSTSSGRPAFERRLSAGLGGQARPPLVTHVLEALVVLRAGRAALQVGLHPPGILAPASAPATSNST